MATFGERAAHSVNSMFSLLCPFVASVVSHFGFECGILVLIVSVPGHCWPCTLWLYDRAKLKKDVFDAFNTLTNCTLSCIRSLDCISKFFLVSCIMFHLPGWNRIPHFLAKLPKRSISF